MPGLSGRPFNSFTPLGRKMLEAQLSVVDVAYATGIHHRTLSNYLAWRLKIRPRDLVRLCALFECDAEEFEPECRVCGDAGCGECRGEE